MHKVKSLVGIGHPVLPLHLSIVQLLLAIDFKSKIPVWHFKRSMVAFISRKQSAWLALFSCSAILVGSFLKLLLKEQP